MIAMSPQRDSIIIVLPVLYHTRTITVRDLYFLTSGVEHRDILISRTDNRSLHFANPHIFVTPPGFG